MLITFETDNRAKYRPKYRCCNKQFIVYWLVTVSNFLYLSVTQPELSNCCDEQTYNCSQFAGEQITSNKTLSRLLIAGEWISGL